MKTERLNIRLIVETDWQSIQKIWIDFSNSEYVYYDTRKDTDSEAVKARIARWAALARNGCDHIFYTVCLDNEVIGYISLNIRDHGYELGYGFLNKYHGYGYAKESIAAVLSAIKRPGIEKIVAGTALKNVPSVNLLKSLHFELVGTEKLAFHKDKFGNEIWFDGGIFELGL